MKIAVGATHGPIQQAHPTLKGSNQISRGCNPRGSIMETLDEQPLEQENEIVADHVKLQMMQHMADGLDDEAAGLGCRAEGIQEEEFLLTREIDQHYTEINRLVLKLQGLRS